jgi:hypothetical protein
LPAARETPAIKTTAARLLIGTPRLSQILRRLFIGRILQNAPRGRNFKTTSGIADALQEYFKKLGAARRLPCGSGRCVIVQEQSPRLELDP